MEMELFRLVLKKCKNSKFLCVPLFQNLLDLRGVVTYKFLRATEIII